MNLLEHHAKTLLREHGLPVPRSQVLKAGQAIPATTTYPVVAKSQVPVGGRGKAGGIVKIDSASEAASRVEQVFSLAIKGHTPSAVLLEEELVIERELYMALRLNRDTRQLEWLASPRGGVEIEANAASVRTFSPEEGFENLPQLLDISPELLLPLLHGFVSVVIESDLLLLEVNPLVVQSNGTVVCADAKVLVDDNARFRHPELPWPPVEGNPPKPLGGTIGCIANGAGMAMSTMDTIVAAGGKPANFLDIGGGTGEKEFVTALKNITELPHVTSIIVNIFAGISRCDEIARGIIAAKKQLPDLPPLFIRLEGTNRDIAAQLLTAADITIEPDLKSCVQKAMEVRV